MKTLALVLSLITGFASLHSWASPRCEAFFNPGSNSLANSYEAQVYELIGEYKKRLGSGHDPFAGAVSPEIGDRIYQKLSVRIRNGKSQHSSYAIMNYNIKKTYLSETKFNDKLIDWVLQDSRYYLSQRNASKEDLQANIQALRLTLEYLRRFHVPEKIVDREGEEQSSDKKKDKKGEKKDEKKQQKQPFDPKFPKLPKNYKPHSKDTSGSGEKQERVRILEYAGITPTFAQAYFGTIIRHAPLPFQQAVLTQLRHVGAYRRTENMMELKLLGEHEAPLFVPKGMRPLQSSDPRARIEAQEDGSFLVRSQEALPQVIIPFIPDNNIQMSPVDRDVYTRRIGFNENEWPDLIRADILRKFKKEDGQTRPLDVARAIAKHINSEYLYSVHERPEEDPIDALKAGAFQCDMAAYIMMGLLRDVYGIPSRVVAGYKAKVALKSDGKKTYLVIPDQAHAWVEVFVNGEWHAFDPTPTKKDSQDDNQQQDDEYMTLEQIEDNKPQDESQEKKREEQKNSVSVPQTNKEKLQEKVKEDTDKRLGETKADLPETPDHFEDQLDVGSLSMQREEYRNVITERIMRILLRAALDPRASGVHAQSQLNHMARTIKRFPSEGLKLLYQKSLSAHKSDHPNMRDWIDELRAGLRDPRMDVNKSYQKVIDMIASLEAFSMTLDSGGRIRRPTELIATLKQVKLLLDKMASPASLDISLTRDLVKDLPMVPRQLLYEDYQFVNAGPNNPTINLAADLKAGKLNDLRLLSSLLPVSEFITNSNPYPEMMEVRTWQQDTMRPQGRDFLPLQRITDWPRAYLLNPHLGLERNIREGTAFIRTRRQRILIPSGMGREESERVTVVLYDTSGSMSGKPARFQAALIAAFVSQALSDLSPSGRQRHRVVIVPYDSTPKDGVPVYTVAQAIGIIRNYQSELKNTNGGTDIQLALMKAFQLILDAQAVADSPLASANIFLMGDGQADVDISKLMALRNQIDRTTILQMGFASINMTNPELVKLSQSTAEFGADRGMYREFTPDVIDEYLKNADSLDISKQEHFYTDQKPADIPAEVDALLSSAYAQSIQYLDHVAAGSTYASPQHHYDNLERIQWPSVKEVERPLENHLIRARQMLGGLTYAKGALLERVADDLIVNSQIITGIPFHQYSGHEIEHVRHILKQVAGRELGKKEGKP